MSMCVFFFHFTEYGGLFVCFDRCFSLLFAWIVVVFVVVVIDGQRRMYRTAFGGSNSTGELVPD